MQCRHHLLTPDAEVRHYPIGGSSAVPVAVPEDALAVSEDYETTVRQTTPGIGAPFVEVELVRMGSEVIPTRFRLLEWARRRANSAQRFFAGI